MTLPIPVAALTQHVIALGKTRSGKSSKLRVCVEWLLDNENPVCIIDPKGDWWGLKSSADGKRSGYPLVIFGGEHADVPINAHSGAHIAELFATGNRSCLIDLGGWMMGERTRFFIDFASTLFKLTKGRRYLVMPEVHNFCPKGKVFDPESGKMLHWANRLASEGLGKGIVILADSQRPQKVHNDYLTSCETLVACKVIHKADRDAIKDWIDGCADPGIGKSVLESLAQLQKPEAWVWSPEVDFGPKLVTWPMFKTYDSFKPQLADAGKLKGWAEVNLDDVKAKLATVVEEAKANDPKALRARIAELERKLDHGENDEREMEKAIERGKDVGRREGYEAGAAAASASFAKRIQLVLDKAEANARVVGEMQNAANSVVSDLLGLMSYASTAQPDGARPANPVRSGPPVRSAPSQARPAPRARPIDGREASNGSGKSKLGGMALKILTVLSQYEDGCDKDKLTLLAGYTYSGSFQNALSSLRGQGFIEGENNTVMRITRDGLAQGPFPELPSGDALRSHWLNHAAFGKMARTILEQLLACPTGITANDICAATGYTYSGSFQNALSELRTAGVLVGKNTGTMTASEELLA